MGESPSHLTLEDVSRHEEGRKYWKLHIQDFNPIWLSCLTFYSLDCLIVPLGTVICNHFLIIHTQKVSISKDCQEEQYRNTNWVFPVLIHDRHVSNQRKQLTSQHQPGWTFPIHGLTSSLQDSDTCGATKTTVITWSRQAGMTHQVWYGTWHPSEIKQSFFS